MILTYTFNTNNKFAFNVLSNIITALTGYYESFFDIVVLHVL